jgi:hypothetical protein
MGELSDFVGTWHAEREAPFSSHTITWEKTAAGLRGRWIVDAANTRAARAAAAAGRPTRFEMAVGDPSQELTGPDELLSIEGHRVQLSRQSERLV